MLAQMIYKNEIDSKAKEFQINHANVERDYVFSWVLSGIYSASKLRDILILKGGNAFRKAYFATTRFSSDLDFATESQVELGFLKQELNEVCQFVQESTGVEFLIEKNKVEEKELVDKSVNAKTVRIYFRDFYGNSDTLTISIRLDIREFDRIYLPIQSRNLIHPYSDASRCKATVKCLKLEEMLANKLKCLLQRRHSFDLFDFVYAVFFNNELAVDKNEIVSVFLKKTIYQRSPGVVRNLLMGLPFDFIGAAWEKYLVCPAKSKIPIAAAIEQFTKGVTELFGDYVHPQIEKLFYPAEKRNLILDAGREQQLLELKYKGVTRIVEPYSLVYKRRKDGHGEEYFYVWDRTGGSSPPGIKTLLNEGVESISKLDEKFEPRYTIELAKSGEHQGKGYFGGGAFSQKGLPAAYRNRDGLIRYIVECSYCGKRFPRIKYNARLRAHKDAYGNKCYGRMGRIESR